MSVPEIVYVDFEVELEVLERIQGIVVYPVEMVMRMVEGSIIATVHKLAIGEDLILTEIERIIHGYRKLNDTILKKSQTEGNRDFWKEEYERVQEENDQLRKQMKKEKDFCMNRISNLGLAISDIVLSKIEAIKP